MYGALHRSTHINHPVRYYNHYHTGYYYGYRYRSNGYEKINGSVCSNNQTYDGIIYGQFVCPIDGFKATETECCGEVGEQFCCEEDTSYYYLLIPVVSLIFVASMILANNVLKRIKMKRSGGL